MTNHTLTKTGTKVPKTIRLTGLPDLDLSERGIKAGEVHSVSHYDETSKACFVKSDEENDTYQFIVYPNNYEVLHYR